MNLFINGEEITNHQFMPGTQQYDKRLMIETLEVTRFLREGENEIMVSLGDGWYRGAMGFSQNKNIYGTDLALLLQFEIAREPIVVSDETWTATQDGPGVFFCDVADDFVGLPFHVHHAAGCGQVNTARKGGNHAVFSALKQRSTQLLFQTQQLLIQGRLGEIQLFSCLGYALFLFDGNNIFNLA